MKPYSFILCVLAIVLLACNRQQTHLPFPIEKLESQRAIAFPHQDPEKWVMAHVDLETTGLLPGYHEMIDLGMVITDLDGSIIDVLFIRINPKHPERLSPGAKKINAYDPERWKDLSALTQKEAIDSIMKFHSRVVGEKNCLLVAYNSHFDTAFLDYLLREDAKSWRDLFFYFVLDIPSMAWSLGMTDLTAKSYMDSLSIADERHIPELHTGISGAMKNVRVYQALLRYRKQRLKIQGKDNRTFR